MVHERFRMMAGLACLLAGMSACGAEVRVGGNGPEGEPSGACTEPGETELVAIHSRTRGTFIDGRLHLMAAVDEEPARYTVLALHDGYAEIAAQPELSGPTQLLAIGDGTYLRLVTEGGTQVQALDLQDPAAPELLWSRAAEGLVPDAMARTFTVIDHHLFFCLTPPELETGTAVLDLSDPLGPESLERWLFGNCDDGLDGAAAAGSLWAGFSAGEGFETSDVRTWQLAPEQADLGNSFGYNPSGVHSYGRARSIATDGELVVVDPASNAWMLLFNATDFPLSGPYVAFGPAGPKKLLTVFDAHAYFATPSGIHSYDLSDFETQSPGATSAKLALDPEAVTFVAIDEQQLIIADGEGALYRIPIGSTSQPERLMLREPSRTAPCD